MWRARLLLRAFGFKNDVGIDKAPLESANNRFVLIDRTTEVAPNVHVITEICDRFAQPKGNQYLYTQSHGGGYEQDIFEHELLLVIKEEDGLGCLYGLCATAVC